MSKHAGASRKGEAAEQLVAAISVLATGGELNALTALASIVQQGRESVRLQ